MARRSASHYRFPGMRHFSLAAPLEAKTKSGIFSRRSLRLGKKTKAIIAFGIIIIFSVSIFAFLPKQNGSQSNVDPQSSDDPTNSPTPGQSNTSQPSGHNIISDIGKAISDALDSVLPAQAAGTIETSKVANTNMWKVVAKNAWQYFQPGVGVDPNTGLPCAGFGYPYFTDWDLGSYIEAVMDANTIGLINATGTWGSSMRLERVVSFLETRELNTSTSSHFPFWFYQATDGKDWHAQSDNGTGCDVIDTGRLFVALNNLENFNSTLKLRIDNLVHNTSGNRTDYTVLLNEIKADSLSSTSIYAYFVDSGYASFFPDLLKDAPATILNNMQKAGNVTLDELSLSSDSIITVTLPKAGITCDPLLCSVFENKSNSYLSNLAYNVYLAHEAKHNADPSGSFWATSEGNSGFGLYIWEWVVTPSGDTWIMTGNYFDMPPIIYNKVSISFLALYNTTYAYQMSVYLEKNLPDPSAKGYYDGIDTQGRPVSLVGCNTNSLILSASRYALQS
jgi:hypothetical protein